MAKKVKEADLRGTTSETVRLANELVAWLDARAEQENRSRANLIENAIETGEGQRGAIVKKKNQVGVRYEIRVSSASGKSTKPDEYITAVKAEEQHHGWLHYELRDGTNGLAQPKNWRKVEEALRVREGKKQ